VTNSKVGVSTVADPQRPGGPARDPREQRQSAFGRIAGNQQVVLLLVLIVMIVIFSVINPKFFSVGVFGNILQDWGPIALIAIAETFVVVSGGIDLSVGSTITISGVAGAFAMQAMSTSAGAPDALSLLVGLVVCVATGLLVGVVNALLINVAKLVPFIATLVTLGAGAGLALVLTGGGPIGGGPAAASSLPVPVVGPFSIPTLIVIVIAVISGLFLHLARFGRYTYAIGGNEFSAIASGISVRRHITKVYMLSGALAGLAGMITYANLSGGSPSAGAGGELNAIAAVVIGGASLTGGVGRMTGTVIGSLILVTVTSGLIVANIDPNWNQVVVAILIAAAVAIQTIRRGVHSHGRKS
jgi:ribose transport system permease protein